MRREIGIDNSWLCDRGDLHDSTVLGFEDRGEEFSILIDDEWWNFEGWPEYKGPSPGAIVAKGIRKKPEIPTLMEANISEVRLVGDQPLPVLRIVFWGGGVFDVEAASFFWRPSDAARS